MNIENFCHKIPLFKNLSPEQIKRIAVSLILKHYTKNETIFLEGSQANSLYIVFTGKVKVFKLSRQGKEQILHILHPTDLLAEVPMFAGENYPANCAALEDTALLCLAREKLLLLIKAEPQIALNMLALQAKRLREFTLQLESVATQDTTERLTKYLQAHQDKAGVVKLDISLTALAKLLGVSRENLSRTISKMVQAGEIKYLRKQIELL